ncbi:hypothetical protein CASFOL_036533 [Castilleja foliolosa]|uniref:Uncharacterized protein n=1 Tax=Castilleja foliolosa TaxID=1961234 RepID=A0ABD3BVT9_9LAMI
MMTWLRGVATDKRERPRGGGSAMVRGWYSNGRRRQLVDKAGDVQQLCYFLLP